jgi:hypothetical protein
LRSLVNHAKNRTFQAASAAGNQVDLSLCTPTAARQAVQDAATCSVSEGIDISCNMAAMALPQVPTEGHWLASSELFIGSRVTKKGFIFSTLETTLPLVAQNLH